MTSQVQTQASHGNYVVRRFKTTAAAATALAGAVASDLAGAIAARETARLALGGGSTPVRFLIELGRRPIAWHSVRTTLTDERWVPAGHPRANATMVADTLLTGAARVCSWFPLYVEGKDVQTGVGILNERMQTFGLPLDVVILGMGDDGHVASLFPGSPWDAPTGSALIAAQSPAGEPRVSLSLATLKSARHCYLLLHGERKSEVLRQADGTGLPIDALVTGALSPVNVYLAEGMHS